MSYPLPEKPKPKKMKRHYGWLTTAFLILLLIGLVSAGVFFYALGSVTGSGPRQKELVAQIFTGLSGQPVAVQTLRHFALMPDVIYDLSGLSWPLADQQITIGDLRTRIGLFSLMNGNPVLHEVAVKDIRVPEGALSVQALQIDTINITSADVANPQLVFTGSLGEKKTALKIGLEGFLDAMSKPYYKVPTSAPITGHVGDLDFTGVWQRTGHVNLKNMRVFRRKFPDDVVTADLSWQRAEKGLVLAGKAKSAKSDMAFTVTLPADEVGQVRIEGEKADWDDVYGTTTLSALRGLLADIVLLQQAEREIVLGSGKTLRCGAAGSENGEKEIHARLLQHCLNRR